MGRINYRHEIERLRAEAGEAGDTLQVALCDLALHGEAGAAQLALLTDDERAMLAKFDAELAWEACVHDIATGCRVRSV